jgi:hypothetical protein
MLPALLVGYKLSQLYFVVADPNLELTATDAMHFDGGLDYLRPESL